jgi:hypothetical protein
MKQSQSHIDKRKKSLSSFYKKKRIERIQSMNINEEIKNYLLSEDDHSTYYRLYDSYYNYRRRTSNKIITFEQYIDRYVLYKNDRSMGKIMDQMMNRGYINTDHSVEEITSFIISMCFNHRTPYQLSDPLKIDR